MMANEWSGWNVSAMPPAETPLVILAEGCFGESASKLALGVIRYGEWPVVAVVDSRQAGRTVREVTGIACDAPIVATLVEALPYAPKALLLGNAPAGGQLPPDWMATLAAAIQAGLHVISGLHFFLREEDTLVELARRHEVRLWDVRDPDGYGPGKFRDINHRKPRPANVRVVLMVGTDCAVGKMHAALELFACARRQGASAGFIATGQTGILIAGRGVPLDRVIGDFMAGAVEECIHDEIERLERQAPGEPHWLFVEGQGSLLHPAYSGVTLSLLHGADPDAMILCHKAGLSAIRNYPQISVPSLKDVIAFYESAAAWNRMHPEKAAVRGICVNSSELPESEAETFLAAIRAEAGVPAADPVRYGVESVWQALQDAFPLQKLANRKNPPGESPSPRAEANA
jgi:uncharacterized NAD-dependent epimerase/dehydratase family protein